MEKLINFNSDISVFGQLRNAIVIQKKENREYIENNSSPLELEEKLKDLEESYYLFYDKLGLINNKIEKK